jgi:hypothetical protein
MSESTSSSLSSSLTRTLPTGASEFIGYQCDKLVGDNTLVKVDLTYYIDLMWTDDTEETAVNLVRVGVIDAVASTFGISSGVRCNEPPDGSTWMVKVTSESSQYNRVDGFDECKLLVPGASQECSFYELVVTGYFLGGNELPVKQYIETLLKGNELTSNNSPLELAFRGVPIVNPNEEGRDSLSDTASIQEADQNTDSGKKNQDITIVGGLLVAAFCLAFLGIIFVVWRRRKHYLRSRDVQLALSKSDMHYDARATDSEDEPRTLEKQTDSEDFEDMRGGKSEEEFPNNITFDLGNSFKDQLMGVHGPSQPNKLGGMSGMGGMGWVSMRWS